MPSSASTFSFACLASVWLPAMAGQPVCVEEAARHYGVDRRIVQAVLRVEGGRVGLRSPNANGSYDLGPMQINTLWLNALRAHGIGERELLWDYCTNVAVGTWILARELHASQASFNTAGYWTAVGRYHSRTPHLNLKYAVRVWAQARRAIPPPEPGG